MVSSVCERLLSNASLSPLISDLRTLTHTNPSSVGASNRSMATATSPLRRRELHLRSQIPLPSQLQLSANGKTSLGFSARAFSSWKSSSWKDDLGIELDTTISVEEEIENAQEIMSVLAINDKGELLVGTPCENSQTQTEMEMAPCKIVKAPNGDAWVEANGQKFSPFQIGAFFLAQMREFVSNTLEGRIRRLIVKVPACLRDVEIDVSFYTSFWDREYTVFAKEEATGKEMELDFLIDSGYHTTVDNIERWLNKYRQEIPTEIATEIENAVSLHKREERPYDEKSFCKGLDKLKGARDALSKLGQHMSKNSMKEKIENAQGSLSVVAINNEGELFVGTSTKRFEGSQTETKMEMAPCKIVEDPNGDVWVEANGRKYSPSQVGAFVVSKMKEFAEAHLGKTVTKADFKLWGYVLDVPVKVTFSISPDGGVVTALAEEILPYWKRHKFE
ncbi:PREDICTED: heat shock 70 kDa protein 9, mitochondrial-like [Tarenaya hassleriana]|uniref:heat shock 70 kDa protein 9, mitochondrial-like n=1 Tax=Tarenaya hassleriana TaxID=28532 RepID=UPI00053C192D|nr:PREDICTED: heat shock 70 kDa protein 9, mitochondrial-like [Tarenaya hassleriana]